MSNTFNDKGIALITGSSTGIGAVYADRLARRGHDLILVARGRERLERLATRVAGLTGRSVTTVPADLGRMEDVLRVEEILRGTPGITLLVNSAGLGAVGSVLDSDVNKMEAMIDLNVTALTRLTYAVAPRFATRGHGTIINIASVVAIRPELLLNGVYGATKAFVMAFTQSLHSELTARGVRVQAVLPGPTRTEFWDVAHMPVDNLPAEAVMTADDLVDAALSGLDQGEVITMPTLENVEFWNAFEAARLAFGVEQLSRSSPAMRYGVSSRAKAA